MSPYLSIYTDFKYVFNLSISKSDPARVVISEGTTTDSPMNSGKKAFTLNGIIELKACVGIRNPIPLKMDLPSSELFK